MAVTKQLYTQANSGAYNPTAFFAQLRLAFIDAGYMTEWYDAYGSTSTPNRVLEVVWDASKTYGKLYYHFQAVNYSPSVYLRVSTGWDAANHVPTGTQYLDWVISNGSTINGHILCQHADSTDLVIRRYSTSLGNQFSWFTVSINTNHWNFGIVKPSPTFQPWVDLNKGCVNLMYHANAFTGANRGTINFIRYNSLRREIGRGTALNGSTSVEDYFGSTYGWSHGSEYAYTSFGKGSNQWIANAGGFTTQSTAIVLPSGFSEVNGAFSADQNPVFHSLPFSQMITNNLTADFGVAMIYNANTVQPYDKLVVTAGVEEWEVITRANSGNLNNGATPVFCARVV
jgi:hypothetical protein